MRAGAWVILAILVAGCASTHGPVTSPKRTTTVATTAATTSPPANTTSATTSAGPSKATVAPWHPDPCDASGVQELAANAWPAAATNGSNPMSAAHLAAALGTRLVAESALKPADTEAGWTQAWTTDDGRITTLAGLFFTYTTRNATRADAWLADGPGQARAVLSALGYTQPGLVEAPGSLRLPLLDAGGTVPVLAFSPYSSPAAGKGLDLTLYRLYDVDTSALSRSQADLESAGLAFADCWMQGLAGFSPDWYDPSAPHAPTVEILGGAVRLSVGFVLHPPEAACAYVVHVDAATGAVWRFDPDPQAGCP